MIKLRQPSLALHSCDVPGYKYQMWQTWTMPRGASASDVAYWINYAIDQSPEMRLNNVVINCHGTPGGIYVGGCGNGGRIIRAADLSAFQNIRRGALGTIYIVACEVTKSENDNLIGAAFCSQLAINAGCFVVAADVIQSVDFWYNYVNHPYGTVDDYEGVVTEFSPSGSRRSWNPGAATGTAG